MNDKNKIKELIFQLVIIQERAKAINGSLRIHSELNLGRKVQIEVPLVKS